MATVAAFTAAQQARIRRLAKPKAEAAQGELNVVPFLDIVMNVLMFVLATMAVGFVGTVAVPAPRVGAGHQEALTVRVTPDGYLVAAPGGYLQPGCATVGRATVAVPLRLARHDTAGLSRCLAAARATPGLRDALAREVIHVSPDGAVPYETLVATLDATRETRPGARDLFSRPALGVVR